MKPPSQRCVYGYVGTFDDAIKPLLLLYLFGSAFGTTVLAVFCHRDDSRTFVLATGLHLFPEVLVWTHILFPPVSGFAWKDKGRWIVRSIYGVGLAILLFAPTASGRLTTLMAATYMTAAGISDCLGVWLGSLMIVRRKHDGARRLGVAFFGHGLAFHFVVYESFCKDADAMGVQQLRGFGWILLLVASIFSFRGIFPLFKEPLDLRDEAPRGWEYAYVAIGVFCSLFFTPLIATGGEPPDMAAHYANPAFLPRDPTVLLLYKIIFPLIGFYFIIDVLKQYVDAGLPVLPTSTNNSSTSLTWTVTVKNCPVKKI